MIKKINFRSITTQLVGFIVFTISLFTLTFAIQQPLNFQADAFALPDRAGTIIKQSEIDEFLRLKDSISVYGDLYKKILSSADSNLTSAPKPPSDGIFNTDDPYYPGTEIYNPDADRTDYTNGLDDSNKIRNLALAYRFTGDIKYKNKVMEFITAWDNGMDSYESAPQEQLEISLVLPGFVLGASLIDEVDRYAPFFTRVTEQMLDEGIASGFQITNSNFCALTHQVLGKTECIDIMQREYRDKIENEIYSDGSVEQAHIRDRSHWYSDVQVSGFIRSAYILDQNGRAGFSYVAPNGRNIKMAIDYSVYYALRPDLWPYPNEEPIDDPYTAYQFTSIAIAYNNYKISSYFDVIKRYPNTLDDFRVYGRGVPMLGLTTTSSPTTTPAYPTPTPKIIPTPTPSPTGTNIVLNPGFESDKQYWNFYSNGSATFSIMSSLVEGSKAAKVNIVTAGTNVQLYQYNLSLNPNSNYRIKFMAKSNSGHDLDLVLHQNNSPYTNYGLNRKFDLSSQWQTFSHDFVTTGFTSPVSDARLRLWMAPYDAAGDEYYFDIISLEKLDNFTQPTATPIPTSIPVSTPTPTPTSAPISTSTPTTIPTSAPVPTTTPIPTSSQTIINGDFESGTLPWVFHTNGSGSYTTTSAAYMGTKSALVSISEPGTNVQLYQKSFSLTAGTKYRLAFTAKSNTGHDMYITIMQHASPYTRYGLETTRVKLDSAWKNYSYDFTASGFTGTTTDTRLMFYLAQYDASGDQFYFDNVSLIQL